MGRTVIVGDVHGCRDELCELLDRVAFGEGDRLVSVGDLVVRGPHPAAVIDLVIRLGGRAVRGNHEDRLLRAHADPARRVGPSTAETAAALRPRHWSFVESLPLWLDLPEHGVRVVHAGVCPGVPIERQAPRTLMYMRCLSPSGEPEEQRGGTLWGARYCEAPHVVFGHNAAEDPQIHPAATGLDTGAVYGGRLTALVLAEGASPPPPAERRAALVSVRARRRYAEG
jgi:Calcineurin-like phosphoesterase